ncbi:MAG: NADH-quinone oxidoreductase subunit H [Acidobacteria bacterium]|nr:NADH-quinone oxidoreductase subunit H [Acidobacteriota bacterium]
MTLTQSFVTALLQIVVLALFVFVAVPVIVFAERKVIGYVQLRLGYTRIAGGLHGVTGGLNRLMWWMGKLPFFSILRGFPSFIADGIKLFTKEDIVPEKADWWVFHFAPAISVVAAFTVLGIVSFSPAPLWTWPAAVPIVGGLPFAGVISDVNVGLLMLVGVASVGVYGIVLGGWASNSKYPLLGGLRSAAQIVSYEVPLTFSLLVPVVLSGTLNFTQMSQYLSGAPIQTSAGPAQMPALAILPLFIGFFIYLTCGFAETNRVPFDLPEAETELVAGFHTEYTGMKFGLFYLAEYANMIIVAAVAAAFFLGGHHFLPFGLQRFIPPSVPVVGGASFGWFLLWMALILFSYLWVRATLPRYRYDQLMHVGWKWLIPLSLANLCLAALVRYFA